MVDEFLTEKNINFGAMQNVLAALRGFISENILRSIGYSTGNFVKSDSSNFDDIWKSLLRIRVTMSVDKPVKRRTKIKRDGDRWFWINFKYERLSTFCFVCGLLSHTDRESIVYANPEKEIEHAYGTWLRAPLRNNKTNIGDKWLRNSQGGNGSWTWKTEKQGSMSAMHGSDHVD